MGWELISLIELKVLFLCFLFPGDLASMVSRYPSPAELDAFAHKTASNPLSIKIFPSDVRVPQHKQLNKIVNGLDTTGQRYGQYPGGYQGLLAIVKASVVVKGVLKNFDGKRTKPANSHTPFSCHTPYSSPLNNGRLRLKPYQKPPDTLCSRARVALGERSLAPRKVQSQMRHMDRIPHIQAGGEARSSPSVQAVAVVARSQSSDFVPGAPPPPQSALAFTGAVIPTQSADMAKATYVDKGDYATWKQAPYQQGAMQVYGIGEGDGGALQHSPETHLPLSYHSQLSYSLHPPNMGSGQKRGSGGATVTGDFPVAPYFTPIWDNMVATPNSDCYTSQVLATGICAARPRDLALSQPLPQCNPHCHHHSLYHQPQLHPLPPPLPPPPPHSQAYSAGPNFRCRLPSSSLCHTAALSSSLQSLECLIGELRPPCIKECMLGHRYEAVGMPPLLLEPHPLQLPVYR